MSSTTARAGRGLSASLRSFSLMAGVTGAAIMVVLVVSACGGPSGSTPEAPSSEDSGGAAPPSGSPAAAAGDPARSAALREIGGQELHVVGFAVDDALAAEGGDAIDAMLSDLGLAAGGVEVNLAVAADGDPAISDWLLPGASAADILDAWRAHAPGTWSETSLDGAPAATGEGPDGTQAWAVAADGRFVYVRTEDEEIATEVARAVRP